MTAINKVEKEKNIKKTLIAAFSIKSLSIFNFITLTIDISLCYCSSYYDCISNNIISNWSHKWF